MRVAEASAGGVRLRGTGSGGIYWADAESVAERWKLARNVFELI